MRLLFLKTALISCIFIGCSTASARIYHPDFDCAHVNRDIPVQVLLCADSDSARSLLVLDQAYYALRHQSPVYLLPQLRTGLAHDLEAVQDCFPADGIYGESPAACYQRTVGQVTDRYRARLTGRAHEEAVRPIDDHLALQKRLRNLGYLSGGSTVDGVYGDTTREAILRWQEQTGQPHQDGFLGDEDARMLLPELLAAGNGGKVSVPHGRVSTAVQDMSRPAGDGSGQTVPSGHDAGPGPVHDGQGGGPAVLKIMVHLYGLAMQTAGGLLTELWKLVLPVLLVPMKLVGVIWQVAEVLFSLKILLVLVGGLVFYQRWRFGKKAKVGFSSDRERDCYQKAGMLWAGWIRELDIARGEQLLEHLVERRLGSCFRFLVGLVRPIRGGTARSILEELGKGRTWQDFYRCSVHVHGLLQQVAKAGEARTKRQQEQQKRAEEAERERRRQGERARRQQRQRSGSSPGSSGRAWHVVLEVSERATREEIISAYRRLIKQHHPDRFAHIGGAAYERAVRRTAEITQAYQYAKQYRQF